MAAGAGSPTALLLLFRDPRVAVSVCHVRSAPFWAGAGRNQAEPVRRRSGPTLAALTADAVQQRLAV